MIFPLNADCEKIHLSFIPKFSQDCFSFKINLYSVSDLPLNDTNSPPICLEAFNKLSLTVTFMQKIFKNIKSSDLLSFDSRMSLKTKNLPNFLLLPCFEFSALALNNFSILLLYPLNKSSFNSKFYLFLSPPENLTY